ncbi:MAG: hypothetical protein KatS3mg089_0238 [Patescibacteria group bacterium]|nr:MAG: hypothetical protein KatS3mg089_0238 [Patescibacteria group bacterium]
MPVLKHAKKKLRQDIKRTRANKRIKSLYKQLLKKAKENPTAEAVSVAFKAIDKAAKRNVIHTNKAARLKSALSKIYAGSLKKEQNVEDKKKEAKTSEKTAKKTTSTTKLSTKTKKAAEKK